MHDGGAADPFRDFFVFAGVVGVGEEVAARRLVALSLASLLVPSADRGSLQAERMDIPPCVPLGLCPPPQQESAPLPDARYKPSNCLVPFRLNSGIFLEQAVRQHLFSWLPLTCWFETAPRRAGCVFRLAGGTTGIQASTFFFF